MSQASQGDAFERLPLVSSEPIDLPRLGEPWPGLPVAEQFIAFYELSLAPFESAVSTGGQLWVSPVIGQDYLGLGPLYELTWASRALLLKAIIGAHRGNWRGTVKATDRILDIACLLEDEPLLNTQMAAALNLELAVQAIRPLISQPQLPDSALIAWQNRLADRLQADRLKRALVGDRVIGIMFFTESSEPVFQDVAPWKPLKTTNFIRYLDEMDRLIEASFRPWPAPLEEAKRFQQDIHKERPYEPAFMYEWIRFQTSDHLDTLELIGRGIAQLRCAMTALACERYRRLHHRLPEKLEQLTPALIASVQPDPFDGRPIRYRITKSGFVVYSVGPDQRDDGGQDPPHRSSSRDVTFPVSYSAGVLHGDYRPSTSPP